jgi:hypothetical protein
MKEKIKNSHRVSSTTKGGPELGRKKREKKRRVWPQEGG